MRAFAIATVLLFISMLSSGQENRLTWNENKRLRWDDFSGKVNDTSRFDAESYAEVKFDYIFNSPRNFRFTVKAIFNRGTWWIKQRHKSDELLKHEQVHFDIAELYARKLQLAFDTYQYTSNFRNEICEVFNKVKKHYHQTQQLYDEETNHAIVASNQRQWEILIKEELDKMKKLNTNRNEPVFVKSK